jgi:hypothetical protein
MREPGPEEERLNVAGGIVRAVAGSLLIYLVLYILWTMAF